MGLSVIKLASFIGRTRTRQPYDQAVCLQVQDTESSNPYLDCADSKSLRAQTVGTTSAKLLKYKVIYLPGVCKGERGARLEVPESAGGS